MKGDILSYARMDKFSDFVLISEDSVLLCLASEHCDPAEYIREYDMFVKEVR